MRTFSEPVVLLDHLPLSRAVTARGLAVLEAEFCAVGLRVTGVEGGCLRVVFSDSLECDFHTAGRIEGVFCTMASCFAPGSILIAGCRDVTYAGDDPSGPGSFDRFDVIKIWIDGHGEVHRVAKGYPVGRRDRLAAFYRRAARPPAP